jgi:hypothetical protein
MNLSKGLRRMKQFLFYFFIYFNGPLQTFVKKKRLVGEPLQRFVMVSG